MQLERAAGAAARDSSWREQLWQRGAAHLDEAAQGLAVGGHEELFVGVHDVVSLGAPKVVLGQVQVDFVAVKVGVEGGAVCVVEADRALGCGGVQVGRDKGGGGGWPLAWKGGGTGGCAKGKRARFMTGWQRFLMDRARQAAQAPCTATSGGAAVPSHRMTRARCPIMPGLCSVGWRLVSMKSPSSIVRYTICAWQGGGRRRRAGSTKRHELMQALPSHRLFSKCILASPHTHTPTPTHTKADTKN
jgi:hypothetical protein